VSNGVQAAPPIGPPPVLQLHVHHGATHATTACYRRRTMNSEGAGQDWVGRLPARIGADHPGHANMSLTRDRHMSRGRLHTQVADLMDRTVTDINDDRHFHRDQKCPGRPDDADCCLMFPCDNWIGDLHAPVTTG
jgi:hypothetical protein